MNLEIQDKDLPQKVYKEKPFSRSFRSCTDD